MWTPSESFTDPLLVTAKAIIKATGYTFINPVKDGLVRDYRKWPGFDTRPSDWRTGTWTVKRPDYCFKNTPRS